MSLRTFILTEVIPLPTSQQQLNPPWAFDNYRNAINTIQQTAASADDPKLLDLSLKLFDNDAGRRTSIESRAGSMTSAITLAATLVTGVGFTTLRDTIGLSNAAFWAMFLTFVFALLYLTITTVLLFQIQGGDDFRSTPDPTDLLKSPPAETTTDRADVVRITWPDGVPQAVAVKLLRYTIANYEVNNRVMNRLEIAQKCFRNALLVLVTGGIVTVLLMLTAPNAASGVRLAQALAIGAGCNDLPTLTVDQKGRWAGTCRRSGKPVNVIINADGRAEFPP